MCGGPRNFLGSGGPAFYGVVSRMEELPELPKGPGAVSLDPPALVFMVSPDNIVITEPVFELRHGLRAAIPNPWAETEEYVIGVLRGTNGLFLLELEESLGKLELHQHGWVCTTLARISAVAEGLGFQMADESKSFTERLLKKAAKGKKKR